MPEVTVDNLIPCESTGVFARAGGIIMDPSQTDHKKQAKEAIAGTLGIPPVIFERNYKI